MLTWFSLLTVLALQMLVMSVDLSDRFLVAHVPGAGAEMAQSMLAAQGTANVGTAAAGQQRTFVDQRLFLLLAGIRIASMNAASAGDTWRRPR